MLKRNLAITAGVTLGVGAISGAAAAIIFRKNKKDVDEGNVTKEDKAYKTKKTASVVAAGVAATAAVAAATAGLVYLVKDDEEQEDSIQLDEWNMDNNEVTEFLNGTEDDETVELTDLMTTDIE